MQGFTPGYHEAASKLGLTELTTSTFSVPFNMGHLLMLAIAPGAVASWYRAGVYVLFPDGTEGTIVDVGNDTCSVEMSDGTVRL
jgi:hypothetical protein